MRDVIRGHATAASYVVRILRHAAFNAIPTGGTFIDCFAPGVGDLVGKTTRESFVDVELEGMVVAIADPAVIVGGCDVRIRSSCLKAAGSGGKSSIEIAADVKPVGARSDIV